MVQVQGAIIFLQLRLQLKTTLCCHDDRCNPIRSLWLRAHRGVSYAEDWTAEQIGKPGLFAEQDKQRYCDLYKTAGRPMPRVFKAELEVPPPPPPLVDTPTLQPDQAAVSARNIEEDMTPPPPPPEPALQPGKPALPAATVAADANSPAEAAQDSARLEALKKIQEFEEDVLIHIPGDSWSRSIMRLTHCAMTGCSRAACHACETSPFRSDAEMVSQLVLPQCVGSLH